MTPIIERATFISKMLNETKSEDRVLNLRIMAISEQVKALILDLEKEETNKAKALEITSL